MSFYYCIGYVEEMAKVLFTLHKSEMKRIADRYSSITPKPLNTQFPTRRTKAEGLQLHNKCKKGRTKLYPTGTQQTLNHSKLK